MAEERGASEVREAQMRFWAAANRSDVAMLDAIIDEDFVLVEADTHERKDKAAFLADIAERAEEEQLIRFELRAVKVQIRGEMAVAYAQFHCVDEIEGERLEMGGNAVDVFVRRGAEWKLAGSVYGEVPVLSE